MPSWSASEGRTEHAVTPPGTTDATEIEAARKLLEELFAELPRDERPPRPEQ